MHDAESQQFLRRQEVHDCEREPRQPLASNFATHFRAGLRPSNDHLNSGISRKYESSAQTGTLFVVPRCLGLKIVPELG